MKILKELKNLALILVCVELVMSPIAAAAEQAKTNLPQMREFLKQTGLSKGKVTVGDFYRSMYSELTPQEREMIEPYVILYQNDLMPSVEAVPFVDKNKVEQVRLIVNVNGKAHSLQTEGYDKTFKMKFDNATLTLADTQIKDGLFQKIVPELGPTKNPKDVYKLPIMPSKAEWDKWDPVAKAEFFVHLRYLMEDIMVILPEDASQQTSANEDDAMSKFAMVFEMLMPEACAIKKGDDCIVAGWMSTYGEGNSCGGIKSGWENLQSQFKSGGYKDAAASCASSSTMPCNPLFYGFGGDGKPHCISRAKNKARTATEQCNGLSLLGKDANGNKVSAEQEAENVRRIVNSFLKGKGEKGEVKSIKAKGGDFFVTQEEYDMVKGQLDGLQSTFRTAMGYCGMSEDKNVESSPNAKLIKDQKEACINLRERFISIQKLKVEGPVVKPKDPGTETKACPDPGPAPAVPTCPLTPLQPGTGTPGQPVAPVKVQPGPTVVDTGIPAKLVEPEKKGFCEEHKGGCIAGAIAVIIGLFAIFKGSKRKNPTASVPSDPNPSVTPTSGPVPPPGGNPVIPPPPPPNENTGSNKPAPSTPAGGNNGNR